MDDLGKQTLLTLELLGKEITVQPITFIMTWLVMGLLVLAGFLITRKLKLVPNNSQNMFEIIYEFLKDITYSTLGKTDGKKFLPLIATLFIFILASNWIGVLPNIVEFFGTIIAILHNIVGSDSVTIASESKGILGSIFNSKLAISPDAWYAWMFKVPSFEEPTRSVNTDLAMALVVFVVVHAYGIKNKGILKYLGDYMDPIPAKLPYTLFFFLNPFFYLNIIGNISNVVSHSFRLFGNMFGGFMIVVIVSSLTKNFFIPIGLYAFFGLFAGLVQAFVFTMLAVTYIAQQK